MKSCPLFPHLELSSSQHAIILRNIDIMVWGERCSACVEAWSTCFWEATARVNIEDLGVLSLTIARTQDPESISHPKFTHTGVGYPSADPGHRLSYDMVKILFLGPLNSMARGV
jgi:hypothetical protein